MVARYPIPEKLFEKIQAFLAEQQQGHIELHVDSCGQIIAYKFVRTDKGNVRDL